MLPFLFLTLCFSFLLPSSSLSFCHPDEAIALLHFKHSFSINNSYLNCFFSDSYNPFLIPDRNLSMTSYPKTESWKEGTDCCKWDGVSCDNVNGHIIGLDLSCSRLQGYFHPNSTLFNLPHLQSLNLAFNDFTYSKIPVELGQLTALKHLDLSWSSFGGHVPSIFSHLSKLEYLDLSNLEYLDLPSFKEQLEMERDVFGSLVQNLSQIRHLFLDRINMSSIKVGLLANLSSTLISFSAPDSYLKGSLPEGIFNLPQLKRIDLDGNTELTGNLPDSIGQSKSLSYLTIGDGSLSGSIPNSLGNLSQLSGLALSGNTELTGNLPDSIGQLKSLNYLDIGGCRLSGSIPNSLGNLSQLHYLDLGWNKFSGGQFLPFLTNLTQLEWIYLSACQLSGSIPDHEVTYPNLMSLDLSFNHLIGNIPLWLHNLPQLYDLDLNGNLLTGYIPNFLSTKLLFIDLSGNKFQGLIPDSIYEQKDILKISLSSNRLSGLVDLDRLSKLQNLFYLGLGPNMLTFNTSTSITFPSLSELYIPSLGINEFPAFLKGCNNLTWLDISNNKISHIPKWMFDVSKDSLTYLNLSYNFIEVLDQLPWKDLEIFDISYNSLQQVLPPLPPTLSYLILSNNSFFGEIPYSICLSNFIQIVDLSQNMFNATIPHCLFNSSSVLSVLNLGMNNLGGKIPSTFAQGCQLEYLDLNGNQLEGALPKSIAHCKGLKVLNLGTNHLNGSIPGWVETLPELQVLILRSNNFHGSLGTLGRHKHPFYKLHILDLSNNRFSGHIPEGYMKNLKSMMYLDYNLTSSSMYMQRINGSYEFSVRLTIKGSEMTLEKVLIMFMSIDLSHNKFSGEIPHSIGMLGALKGLNLSQNRLSGRIPRSFGNIKNLEWLDLSSNKLTGQIPKELAECLTFLSTMNLSSNKLTGPIPVGKQFDTFPNGSYAGNEGLCGLPLSKSCMNAPPAVVLQQSTNDLVHQSVIEWKAVLMGYPCGVSFGISVTCFIFRNGDPKWFQKLFQLVCIRRR